MKLFVGRPVVVLIIIAAIVRGSVLWIGFNQLLDDPDAYDAIARTLSTTGTFGVVASGDDTVPTAFRPPLYPTILAVIQRAIIATDEELQDPLISGTTPVSRNAIAVLHWLISLATVVTTYFVARRMLRPSETQGMPSADSIEDPAKLPAFFAGLLVAVDPILVQSSVRVMTETLATLLAVGALYGWCRLIDALKSQPSEHGSVDKKKNQLELRSIMKAALPLGLVLGLAYLCRPTFIVWTAMLIGYLAAWSAWRTFAAVRERVSRSGQTDSVAECTGRASPAIAALTLVAITGLFVSGWTFRNQQHFGKPIWATTHGGYTLLLGNNPSFFQYMRSGSIGIAWDPQPFFDRWETRHTADPRQPVFWASQAPLPPDPVWQATLQDSKIHAELLEDRLAYETAKMAIANDRNGFIWATLWRVGRLLSPMPQVFENASTAKRIGAAAITIYYTATIGLMIWGLFRLGGELLQPRWLAAITLVLSLMVVHSIYWSNMRMRAPAIPAMAILAAAPLSIKLISKKR